MLAILLSSGIAFFLFIIFGTVFAKFGKFSVTIIDKVLLGMAISNSLTSLVSIFFPINSFALLAFLSLAALLGFYVYRELLGYFTLVRKKRNVIFLSAPFIVIALFSAIGPPHNYDTGLYHLQSIKWIEAYPVIPGLANLHGRFGFNPNIFTFYALTSLVGIFKQEIFSINFVLICIFIIYFINTLFLIFKKEGYTNSFVVNLIFFATILGLTYDVTSINLSSPSPDFISLTLPLFIFSRVYNSLNSSEKTGFKQIVIILLLSFYSITVKLATIPILILPLLLLLKFQPPLRKILRILPLILLIILPWLIRNIILTGYLIYPFSSINFFDFDWKVPIANLKLENMNITGWARDPGNSHLAAYHMQIAQWFPIWWKNMARSYQLLFLGSFIMPIFTFFIYARKKVDYYFFAIIATSFLGVIFWFILAPDFRFGFAFVLTAALSPLFYLKFKIHISWEPNFKPTYAFLIMLFFLIYSFRNENGVLTRKTFSRDILARSFIPQHIEIPKNLTFRTFKIGELKVFVPNQGDRCYDFCLPCTPYPDSTLKLRGRTVQYGFRH